MRDRLDKIQWHKLMQLVDAQNLLLEKTALASFTARFKLIRYNKLRKLKEA